MVIPVVPSYFDNAHKLLTIKGQPYVGMVTYGAGALGQAAPRTAHSFLPEFETHLTGVAGVNDAGDQNRLSTETVAQEVATFYGNQWALNGMPPAPLPPGLQALEFLIGGFDEGEAYGRIYEVTIPTAPVPVEKPDFSLTIGGQNDLMGRLVMGYDLRALQLTKDHLGLSDEQTAELLALWRQNLGLPIPYQFLPLQDCVDMSTSIITMTTWVQSWMFGIRGVGGDIDVATITREEGLRHLRQKKVQVFE